MILRLRQLHYAWVVVAVTASVDVSLVAFGLGGPLGGGRIDRFGPRRVVLGDFHLMFITAAILGFIAAGLSLGITPSRKPQLAAVAGAS